MKLQIKNIGITLKRGKLHGPKTYEVILTVTWLKKIRDESNEWSEAFIEQLFSVQLFAYVDTKCIL
jgi:hypothetical protein